MTREEVEEAIAKVEKSFDGTLSMREGSLLFAAMLKAVVAYVDEKIK